jgi:hypothetical protein
VAASRVPSDLVFSVDPGGSDDAIAEKFRITCNGDALVANGGGLVVGHTAQLTFGNYVPELQVLGTNVTDASIGIAAYSASAVSGDLAFAKSRGAAIGTDTIVQDNDVIGRIVFCPADGDDIATHAAIFSAEVDDASPAAGDIGMAFTWSAMAGGGGAIAERMRIAAGGKLTVSTGSVVLGESTVPAGTECYIGRDNTGDTTINALTGKTINLAINGSDIATLSATVLGFTGTLAATGARVTQAYFTNHTTTNAETVDCWGQTKKNIVDYTKSALDVIRGTRVAVYEHDLLYDPSDRRKLGVIAETIDEPLVLPEGEYVEKGMGPRLDMLGLAALNTKAIQELLGIVSDLRQRLALAEAKIA